MKVGYRVFWLPKAGLSTDEYEDAFAPAEAPEAELKEFRCAVSDGATETSFSGIWARILCSAFHADKFNLHDLQAEWLKEVSGKKLPWYAEQKLESGAYATLLTLCLQEAEDEISWSVQALGDSCLFHVREGQVLKALPLDDWEAFDYTPVLISTKQAANEGVLSSQDNEQGTCLKGDIFYLMTDAISKWFLRRNSEQGDSIELLEAIKNQDEFQQLVDEQRHLRDDRGRPLMPNDDVTWTRICLET